MNRPQRHIRAWALACTLGALAASAQSASLTRTSSFEYYPNGQLKTEVVEPDRADLCLSTTHGYDTWGNRTSTSASACAGAGANTLSSADSARTNGANFGTNGRFATSSTNALGQSETKAYDDRFGAVKTLTGPNGLTTRWDYDNFGRKTKETRADGTYTTWQYQLCSAAGANCPSSVGPHTIEWVRSEQSYNVNNTVAAPLKRIYYDPLERAIRTQTQGFDGAGAAATIVQDSEYNKLGQLIKQSAPYALGIDTAVWSSYQYDALGRVIQEQHPDASAPGGVATTRTTYQGMTIVLTNALGQSKTTLKNSQGQVVQVTDAQGNTITYAYDPVGNLTQTNAAGSVTKLGYDDAGRRKTSMDDPAMGHWIYAYNAFGELVSQTDSLGKTTTIAYDKLGRMTRRSEPDLESQWSYDKNFDQTSCGKSIGKPCQAKANNDYLRSYTYDALGRLGTTKTVLDNPSKPAVVSETFDANTGKVKTKTWPTGYQATYTYTALGYLQGVSASGTGIPSASYQILQVNAQGQIVRYKTGNQVVVVNSFDAQTQRLTAISAAVDGQAAGSVLSQSYSYDALGNLRTRADNSPNVGTQETFSYDSLNRLNLATLAGGAMSPPQTTEVLYDARGNIAYKSDVGRYWYDSARPNRMTNVTLESAPGATVALTGTRQLSYAFDDYSAGAKTLNGVTVGNGNLTYTVTHDTTTNRHFVRTESYTSFNMPQSIAYANFTANTSTCPQGYTLSNGVCKLTSASTTAATPVYSCPSGFTLSGSNCTQTTSTPATMVTFVGYQCPSGYTLSSSNCSKTTTSAATLSYSCPSGSTLSGKTCTETRALQTPAGSTNAADRTLAFIYGPEHQRIRESVTLSGNGTSAYFAGNTWYLNGEDSLGLSYEKEIRANGTTEHKHYVSAAGFVFAIVTQREGTLNGLPASSTRYLIKDHLGSIAAITNESGVVIERLAYDPWGKRRFINVTPGKADNLDTLIGVNTDRGYTEHEHLDEIGVIHMNGRIYDPLMGRFMSADPMIEAPNELASYNRYSYVWNNPLNRTDPSGFCFICDPAKSITDTLNHWGDVIRTDPIASMAVQIAACYYGGVSGCAAYTAASTADRTGSLEEGLKAGVISLLTSGAFKVVGDVSPTGWGNVVGHAVVGCASSVASGGQCGSGALSGAAGSMMSQWGPKFDNLAYDIAAHAVVGGTVSALNGGSFADGARTAAYGYLFNELLHSAAEARAKYGKGTVGHHWVPFGSTTDLDISSEARAVWGLATNGESLPSSVHLPDHGAYNAAVRSELLQYAESRGIDLAQMTADEARGFLSSVKTSNNPAIARIVNRIEYFVAQSASVKTLIRGLSAVGAAGAAEWFYPSPMRAPQCQFNPNIDGC